MNRYFNPIKSPRIKNHPFDREYLKSRVYLSFEIKQKEYTHIITKLEYNSYSRF